MKFTANNKTYFVKWEYLLNFYDRPFNTICRIYDNEHSYDKPIVIGGAACKPPDRFCKNTGRKISLARALNKLFPDTLTMHGDLFPKEARAIAWKEYFKESPKRLNKQYYISAQDIIEHLEGVSKLDPFNEREQAKLEFCNSLLKAIKNNRLK